MTRATKLLVVDSNTASLAMSADGLRLLGLEVITARGGEDALRLLSTDPRIGVLVTDVATADTTDGLALAREARRLRPGLNVIYAAEMPHRVPAAGKVADAPTVRKPFRPAQITGIVAGLRGRPEGSAPESDGTAEAA